MTLFLTNTLTRAKEPFTPLDPARVRLYVCGPTVYDYAHIGNARPVVVFDVLFRLLRHHYGADQVIYVRNITDVDDKIIKAAKANDEPIADLTERTAAAYHADMAALGALPPTREPRATHHIAEMVALIATLIDRGFAYPADGHVLFHVPAMADYGRLSRRNREEMVAGARVEVAPYKRDPADFVLWKPSDPSQPGWDSPWGRGRPGWHIECSAMAKSYLDRSFDIHGGGLDLIFPHHENEIAQSACAHDGAPLAQVWLHNGFVTIGGDKMAKSLGNFFTVRQLLEEGWPGEAIRLCLLSAHYRQPLDFTREGLHQARTALDRWYGALRNAADVPVPGDAGRPAPVLAALDDDLNTPSAISHLHEMAGALNRAGDQNARAACKAELLAAGRMLGVLGQDPEVWLRGARAGGPTDGEIEALMAARVAARKARNFAEADRIRQSLAAQGVILEDRKDGTIWRRG